MAIEIPLLALLLDRSLKVLELPHIFLGMFNGSLSRMASFSLLCCCSENLFSFSFLCLWLAVHGPWEVLLSALASGHKQEHYLCNWTLSEESSSTITDCDSAQVALSKAPISCLQRPPGQKLARLEQHRIVWNGTTKAVGRNIWEFCWATEGKWHISTERRK